MTAEQAIIAVRSRFVDEVATPNGLVVVHDNGPVEDVSSARARVAVVIESDQQIGMGRPKKFRCIGRLEVQLMQPRDRGDDQLTDLASDTLTAFLGQVIDSPSVRFSPPASLLGAVEFEDAMARRTVRVPFIHDYEV